MLKLKNHFLKLGARRFVWGTVLILILTDILNSYYLHLYWVKKQFSKLIIEQTILRNGEEIENFSLDTLQEMKGFMDNTFFFFLFLVLINNLFFYFFYLRKKLWAQGYVLFYTLTAGIFALTFIIDGPILGMSWFIYNLLSIVLYLYLYFGVKLLKEETVLPIPGREKREL